MCVYIYVRMLNNQGVHINDKLDSDLLRALSRFTKR